MLAPLVKRARLTGLAVILVAHFNKSSEARSAMDRVGGAKAIVGMGRSAWTCVREPKKEPKPGEDDSMAIEGPERRLFLKLKNNLAPSKIGGLVYIISEKSIEVEGDNGPESAGTPFIVWLEGTDHVAQEILIENRTGAVGRPNKVDSAKDWLRQYLKTIGDHAWVDVIMVEASKAGHGERTLHRAKQQLRLESGWVGRESHWALPGKLPKIEQAAEPETTVVRPRRRGASPKRHKNTVDLEQREPEMAA